MTSSIDFQIQGELLTDDERRSIHYSMLQLIKRIDACVSCPGGWNVRESIWPARAQKGTRLHQKSLGANLVLQPLSRFGAQEGLSGSRVMISYFEDPDNMILYSRPMVVKLAKPTPVRDKLVDEMKNAQSIRSFAAYTKHRLAVPIHLDKSDITQGRPFTVLWSPFSSSSSIWQDYKLGQRPRPALGIRDMAAYLDTTNPPHHRIELSHTIEEIFRLLLPFHLKNGRASSSMVSLRNEYSWYLHTPYSRNNMHEFWGIEDTIEDLLGRQTINPMKVLERLLKCRFNLQRGAIHGDLHPHNVVFSDTGAAHIIDFGWAQPNRHIAIDFVLLECNLRFVWLPHSVPMKSIDAMASWIGFLDTPPVTGNPDCDRHIKLIQQIRRCADNCFPSDVNWDEEYIVPMFLISCGLLKHINDSRNQLAMRLTLLKLAQYIQDRMLSK